MDSGGSGTVSDPYTVLHLPSRWENDGYMFGFDVNGHKYRSIRYTNPAIPNDFLERMKFFGRGRPALQREPSSIPRSGLRRISRREPADTRRERCRWSGGCAVRTSKPVLRLEYKRFVRELSEDAYAAFPDKPVVAMVGVDPCARIDVNGQKVLDSGDASRRELFGSIWGPVGQQVGGVGRQYHPHRSTPVHGRQQLRGVA